MWRDNPSDNPSDKPPKTDGRFEVLGTKIGKLVDEKNAAYGSAFAKAGDFLRLLYPDGLKPEQYGDALLLVRIFDKQMRIATDKSALGESPYQDIAGYGLLGLCANTKVGAAAQKTEQQHQRVIYPATLRTEEIIAELRAERSKKTHTSKFRAGMRFLPNQTYERSCVVTLMELKDFIYAARDSDEVSEECWECSVGNSTELDGIYHIGTNETPLIDGQTRTIPKDTHSKSSFLAGMRFAPAYGRDREYRLCRCVETNSSAGAELWECYPVDGTGCRRNLYFNIDETPLPEPKEFLAGVKWPNE